MSDGVYS